jgi:oxygen-independent coproporphyrinogen-3 oxidase
MKPGVYVHIPFCEQRCYYCAFTVAVSPEQTYEPYVRRLIREIQLSGFDEPPETIFFGGGTPSILDGTLIEAILASLPCGATEISLEANPGTLTDAKLEQYRRAGVNRISLGAQSFNDEDLKNAGRLHSSADVFRDIASLRKHGFNNISVDLIAGLPHQRIEIWRDNLSVLENVRPEHVSIYMLDVEERSAWGKSGSDIPDDDVFASFYTEAAERLSKAGYVHYEISNWALPGFECRHNLKYWTGVPYRGFGVSAHSFDPEKGGPEHIPLLAEEGWTRHQTRYREASFDGADGVVSSEPMRDFAGLPLRLRPIGLALRATPSARNKEASQHLIDRAATPPLRGGECSYPKRFWNTNSLKEYGDMIDAGRLPISGEEDLTREMRLEEAFLIGLRRTCGFDIWRVAEEIGLCYPPSWFQRVSELEAAGWIQFDGKFLKLTSSGWLLANGVTEELLWPTLLSTSEAIP